MTVTRGLALVAATAALAVPAWGADIQAGQALHEQHCLSCHDSSVYTRDDHRVTSLEGLHRQVQRCEQALELRWFDEDIANVADYLNERYYRFK